MCHQLRQKEQNILFVIQSYKRPTIVINDFRVIMTTTLTTYNITLESSCTIVEPSKY